MSISTTHYPNPNAHNWNKKYVQRWVDFSERCPGGYELVMNHFDWNQQKAIDFFMDYYDGRYESIGNYMECRYEETASWTGSTEDKIPKEFLPHMDWEAYGKHKQSIGDVLVLTPMGNGPIQCFDLQFPQEKVKLRPDKEGE